MTEEWGNMVNLAVGALILLLFLSIGFIIVFMTKNYVDNEAKKLEYAINVEDYSGYNNRVVDSATLKNILRANKERIMIALEDIDTPLDEDPTIAHTQINDMANSANSFVITLESDINDNIILLVIIH